METASTEHNSSLRRAIAIMVGALICVGVILLVRFPIGYVFYWIEPSGEPNGFWVFSWVVTGAVAGIAGGTAAERIARNFNRMAFAVVALACVFVIGWLYLKLSGEPDVFNVQMASLMGTVVGTGVGLWWALK